MISIHNKILSNEEVKILLDYFQKDDEKVDARPDVRSKHPIWEETDWPEYIIQNALTRILNYDYKVEEVVFFESKISYSLHVDSGKCPKSRTGNVVIFPLTVEGLGTTALFNNFWNKDSTRFSRVILEPFEYNLPNKFNELTYVKDLRELLVKCKTDPLSIEDFNVDSAFISTIEYLIDARQDKKVSKTDGRCYDYTDIVNWKADEEFDKTLHQQHLSHIPIETLQGLTLNSIVNWNIGDCFCFEKTRLHCAGSGHKVKTGLTIFTQRA